MEAQKEILQGLRSVVENCIQRIEGRLGLRMRRQVGLMVLDWCVKFCGGLKATRQRAAIPVAKKFMEMMKNACRGAGSQEAGPGSRRKAMGRLFWANREGW